RQKKYWLSLTFSCFLTVALLHLMDNYICIGGNCNPFFKGFGHMAGFFFLLYGALFVGFSLQLMITPMFGFTNERLLRNFGDKAKP
ncbi:MAG: hypothetical protein ACLFR2_08625, partial [Candidatus Kapaibacterium sp.]